MADYAPDLKRRLQAAGCEFFRHGKGGHDVWHSPLSGRKFPIPNKIKSRHTANEILKQAGLPKAFRFHEKGDAFFPGRVPKQRVVMSPAYYMPGQA